MTRFPLTQKRPGSEDADRFVVISGCSAGGKSTLLTELHRRGYATVEEPGRRIVKEELECGGSVLPWMNPEAFLRRAFDLAVGDYNNRQPPRWVGLLRPRCARCGSRPGASVR